MNTPLPHDRAYTYIDRGRALAGNRWLERRWSAFLGTTSGLWHKTAQRVWTNVPGDEVCLSVDGEAQPALALGEVAWTEEADSHGVSLVQERSGAGLRIEVRTFVFHALPAMARCVTVRSRPSGAVLGPGLLDDLRLEVAGGEDPAPTPCCLPADELDGEIGGAVALERAGSGLVMAVEAGGGIDLDAWDQKRVRAVYTVADDAAVGRVTLPVCWLCLYSGSAAADGARVLRRARDVWRERQVEQDERAAEIRRGKDVEE